ASNKHLAGPGDYLSGKAHPVVFAGAWVDDLKMVQTAHAIQLTDIPPMVQLAVKEEDRTEEGKAYFEPKMKEQLADSPAVIAPVARGGRYVRRMVVSAESSFDVNKKPLTYHWSVLCGDADRITIKPLNAAKSVVEIRIPYHERRTVESSVKLETNRVDI